MTDRAGAPAPAPLADAAGEIQQRVAFGARAPDAAARRRPPATPAIPCRPVAVPGARCTVWLCTTRHGHAVYRVAGRERDVASFASIDAVAAWTREVCPPPAPPARAPRPPRPRFEDLFAPKPLPPPKDPIEALTRQRDEAIAATDPARQATGLTTSGRGRAAEIDSRLAADRCIAECSKWTPYPVVGTTCAAEFCGLPGPNDIIVRANGYSRRFTGASIDETTAWVREQCSKRPNGSWSPTPGRAGGPSRPAGGVPKRVGQELPPLGAPAPAAGIPGALPGEICAPLGLLGATVAIYQCSGPDGVFYVAKGQRRPIGSFASVDALLAWANAL